ncbi:ATP-NAD kinase [Acaromyces ingoldii]|uniref:ATP-NAD kinase n=1 Tax=Acaromyces ingoldii TaxID=215250 RepID=A0A316YY86_9BASI|nr:ATP-NAD kinase [Acaromyces ingoldii]PWN93724.1 ATP-NAD kinase [Acaromyces ingoldii]
MAAILGEFSIPWRASRCSGSCLSRWPAQSSLEPFRNTLRRERVRQLSGSPARCSVPNRTVLHQLPDKATIRTGPLGRLSKVLAPRESTKITTRVGSSFGGDHSLSWVQPPRNLLLVKKRHDEKALAALTSIVRHVNERYPDMNIIVETDTYDQLSHTFPHLLAISHDDKDLLASKVDLVVTLGGDGTILHVSSLFDQAAVPPVLSFSMGTLGFLLPYHIGSFETAFRDLLESKASLLLRMRLHQTTHERDGTLIASPDGRANDMHLMNEVALHRGREPHMTIVDAFVDGRHLTRAISDGLIIATPTGSTAYSLSAGGPIVHPSVQSLVLTPICPRSLSFRPLLLPSDSTIQLKVSSTSRSHAEVTVDGRQVRLLTPGQFTQVAMSPYPIPCVNRASTMQRESASGETAGPQLLDKGAQCEGLVLKQNENGRGEDGWVGDINTLLRFNASFEGRGLLGGNGSYEE